MSNLAISALDKAEIVFADVPEEATGPTADELRMINGGQALVNFL